MSTRNAALPAAPDVDAAGRRRRWRLFGHELRVLLRVAGPLIVSQVGMVAMNTTDTIMVGPLGAEALASVGLAASLHTAMLVFFTGTLLGLNPLIAQAFGAGDLPRTRHVLVQGVWLSLLLAVPLALGSLVGEPLARALGQSAAVAETAGGYLAALAASAVPVLLFMAGRQYLEGMGRTAPAMVITFAGVALNVVANRALIHGVGDVVPAMGAVGSGWATTVVRWAMTLALAAYLLSSRERNPFHGVSLRPVAASLRRILGVGVPIGLQLGAEVGIFAFAAVMMGWLGAVELAAHQVTINIASATFMVALGCSLAGSIRVGQHVGAGSPRAVRRAAAGTYLLALGFMGLCALAFLAAPRFLISLYTPDPAIAAVGVRLLFLAALFQLADGAQVAGLCLLRGAADTRVPMLITIGGYWIVGVPVAYLLGFPAGLGGEGIWAGLCVALAAVAAALAVRVRRVLWTGMPVRPAA